jgi:hypothetical protein
MRAPNTGMLAFVDIGHQYSYSHFSPSVFVDPSGKIPQALVGCAIGGVIGGGIRGLSCWLSDEEDCGRKALCAAAGGCITGALAAQFLSAATACITAMIGTAAETLSNATFGDPIDACAVYDWAFALIISCIGAYLASGVEGLKSEDGIRGGLIALFPGLLGGCAGKLDNAFGDRVCP